MSITVKPQREFSPYEQMMWDRWALARVSNSLWAGTVDNVCRLLLNNKNRYQAVGTPLNIPWWVVGCLHYRESSVNFTRHLHNGDPLTARTLHIPVGRPVSGQPPFTWEQSATDALSMRFLGLNSWDLVNGLVRMESYNGLGYQRHGHVSPYIWSYTTIYQCGKFASDSVYDPNLVDKQPGCAALLKGLESEGETLAGL